MDQHDGRLQNSGDVRLTTIIGIIHVLSPIRSAHRLFEESRHLLRNNLGYERVFICLKEGIKEDGADYYGITADGNHMDEPCGPNCPAYNLDDWDDLKISVRNNIEIKNPDGSIQGIGDQILAPLVSHEKELLGYLGADNLGSGKAWDSTDQQVFNLLSTFMVNFLVNVQNYSKLEEKQRWMQTVVDHLPNYIYVKDADSKFLLANRKVCREMGAEDPEALLGKSDFDYYKEELAKKYRDDEVAIMSKGEPILNAVEPCRDSDGNQTWLMTTKIPIKDENGNVVCLVGTGTDITERKLTEIRLEESEERFRVIIESAHDAILMYNADNELQLCNRAAEIIFGYSRDELTDMPFNKLVSDKTYRSGGIDNACIQMGHRKDGSTVPIELSVSHVKMKGVGHAVYTIRDVSEREAALHQTLKLTAAIEQSEDGFIISDPEGKIIYVNKSYQTITGYTRQEAVSGRWIIPKDDVSGGSAADGKLDLRQEENRKISRDALRKDGTTYHEEVNTFPIYDAVTQTCDYVTIIRDVSEERALEASLRQAQKLESVGQLAAGIAHEVNTPIQFVNDNLHFLKESVAELMELQKSETELIQAYQSDSPPSEELVQNIVKAQEDADLEYLAEEVPMAFEQSIDGVKRVSTIVKAMKEFAHPGTTELAPTNLNEAIQTTVTVARNEWRHTAELDMNLDSSLPAVPCIASEINQVILNLIINARDAIEDGKKDSDEPNRIVITTTQEKDYVKICVNDNGCGIPEDVQKRIFDPFFTTKEVGRGSGQGLAIAHDVVSKKHGGKLYFETEANVGTTFIIELPLTAPCADTEAA